MDVGIFEIKGLKNDCIDFYAVFAKWSALSAGAGFKLSKSSILLVEKKLGGLNVLFYI